MMGWLLAALIAIFPTYSNGIANLRVITNVTYDAEGIPMAELTRSIQIIEAGRIGGVGFGCIDVGTTRLEQEAVYNLDVNIPAKLAGRTALVARSFALPGCLGGVSRISAETAFVFTGGPQPPMLVSDSGGK